MILIFQIVAGFALFSLAIGYYYEAEIQVAPVLGLMLGGLYSYTDYDEEREHTLQALVVFVSITIVWQTGLQS